MAVGHAVPTRSRRRWFVMAGAAVLAAVAVGLAGEAMRPKNAGPRVLTDRTYVRLANDQCARTLPDLRPPDTGPFGQTATPDQTATQIDNAAGGLDAMADRLAALPAAAVDQPHLDAWLAGWHRYTAVGRQYADALRQNPNGHLQPLINDGAREARTADNFALANGLKSCTLFATPQPDPSNGF